MSTDGIDPLASLEWDAATFEVAAQQVIARLTHHLQSLPQQAAHLSGPTDLAALREPLPTTPRALEAILDRLFHDAAPEGRNAPHPLYMAYVPGGGLPQAALADLIAGTINRFTAIDAAAPGLAEIERTVVHWLAEMVGFGAPAYGALLSGGSLANWEAVIAAREAYWPAREGELGTGCAYFSDQTHDCVPKGLRLAGFPERSLRVVPCDQATRIDLVRLRAMIASDRAAGLQPFLLVGNAGNVNSGAVDDLQALADVAAAQRLWFHVDAAYGGFFALTARGRSLLAALARADSVTLDPHKGLFLPFGTGCLLVRRAGPLRAAFDLAANYLPGMLAESERIDICQLTPELSRPFRALRLWLPLQLHGVAAFRDALDEKLDLAREAHTALLQRRGIEALVSPDLSLFAWRHRPDTLTGAALDSHNRQLLARINASGRLHLSSTVVRGEFWLRLIVLNFRTHRAHVETALRAIDEALRSC